MFGINQHDLLVVVFTAGSLVMTVMWLKSSIVKALDIITEMRIQLAEMKTATNEISSLQRSINELQRSAQTAENDIMWIKDKLRSN